MQLDDYNYHNDHRVRAASQTKRLQFDSRTNTLTFALENDAGEACEHTLPARFEVCPTCEGRGSHVNPSIDAGGITGSEWDEWDSDEQESYLSGRYDVQCYECHGARVVPQIDTAQLNAAQRVALKALRALEREDAQCDAEMRAERMMGA